MCSGTVCVWTVSFCFLTDASVPEKKIKVYFQQFLQDLPNGDLKAALLKNKEKSFAFLVR